MKRTITSTIFVLCLVSLLALAVFSRDKTTGAPTHTECFSPPSNTEARTAIGPSSSDSARTVLQIRLAENVEDGTLLWIRHQLCMREVESRIDGEGMGASEFFQLRAVTIFGAND